MSRTVSAFREALKYAFFAGFGTRTWLRNFHPAVLEYAPSPGMPVLIDAIRKYYDGLNIHFDKDEILITTGGSEAIQIIFNCILEDGDEVLIPEPYYPS